MSRRPHVKSKIKVCNKSLFHFQDKKADDGVLTEGLIKSAKRSGQLSLCNRGLGTVPEKLWSIDDLVLEECKDVNFDRSDSERWWNTEPLKFLDLSSNAIIHIPPDVKLLTHLTAFKLHDNALTSLPAEIGQLENLTDLMLDHNKLTGLPKQFYKLTELRVLGLSNNMIETIEPDFGDLVMLKILNLSHNKLSTLPPGMGYLVRLVELDLSHNQLVELPPDLVNLRNLRKMNICNNNLVKLPPLGELRKMEEFNANHNNINELPDFLGCTCLRDIYLADNYIKELTEEFCDNMQHISVLNLKDNKLEILPQNIVLLKKLKRLDLSNNNLNQIPSNMGLLTQLQSISLEGNKLSFVRQDVIRGGTERMMKFLRDRITEECHKDTRTAEDEWPDSYTVKKSQALVVPGRGVDSIPTPVLERAAQAEAHILDISRNNFTKIPTHVNILSQHLTQLIAPHNNVSEVPPELATCTHLQYIDLGNNSLDDLPIELGQLSNMREIIISNNRFKTLPRCVYGMENLEILLAAENKICEINTSSDALGRLKKLAVLDLTNNSIATVPPELGNFTNLRTLAIMGNLFRLPRHSILEKGTLSVLSYLRDRIPK